MSEDQNRSLTEKFMLRLPDGMRDRIKVAAESNGRSMNAEIIYTLDRAYPDESIKGFAGMMTKARVREGMSRSEASKLAGVEPHIWMSLESGKVSPSLSLLRKISKAIHFSPEELQSILTDNTP